MLRCITSTSIPGQVELSLMQVRNVLPVLNVEVIQIIQSNLSRDTLHV